MRLKEMGSQAPPRLNRPRTDVGPGARPALCEAGEFQRQSVCQDVLNCTVVQTARRLFVEFHLRWFAFLNGRNSIEFFSVFGSNAPVHAPNRA